MVSDILSSPIGRTVLPLAPSDHRLSLRLDTRPVRIVGDDANHARLCKAPRASAHRSKRSYCSSGLEFRYRQKIATEDVNDCRFGPNWQGALLMKRVKTSVGIAVNLFDMFDLIARKTSRLTLEDAIRSAIPEDDYEPGEVHQLIVGCHGGESILPTTIIFWSEHWESDPR